MNEPRTPNAVLAELAAHPRADEIAKIARTSGEQAAQARSRGVASFATPLLETSGIRAGDVVTSYGDPVLALDRGAQDAAERLLLGTLLARSIVMEPPQGVDDEDRLAGHLLWLSAHTDLDAFVALEAAMGDRSAGLWGALCDLVRRIDAGREPTFDRADALSGGAALRLATLPDVRAACSRLAEEVRDPSLRAMLEEPGGTAPPTLALKGQLEPAPRSVFTTVLLAISGLLFLFGGGRLLARLALARKQSAELEVTRDGVRIRTRTELLGRVVREAEHVIPAATLVRATREVRFPRIALYGGLLALALGSYVGVALVVDGARAASPSLLGQGLLIVALGVGLELGVTALFPGARGRCRVVFVPRRGASVCVGDLDVTEATELISRLSQRRV